MELKYFLCVETLPSDPKPDLVNKTIAKSLVYSVCDFIFLGLNVKSTLAANNLAALLFLMINLVAVTIQVLLIFFLERLTLNQPVTRMGLEIVPYAEVVHNPMSPVSEGQQALLDAADNREAIRLLNLTTKEGVVTLKNTDRVAREIQIASLLFKVISIGTVLLVNFFHPIGGLSSWLELGTAAGNLAISEFILFRITLEDNYRIRSFFATQMCWPLFLLNYIFLRCSGTPQVDQVIAVQAGTTGVPPTDATENC